VTGTFLCHPRRQRRCLLLPRCITTASPPGLRPQRRCAAPPMWPCPRTHA
jgi:hypothetical protein